ncbi:MAG: hypothetical protein ABII27_04440 [bacterium]
MANKPSPEEKLLNLIRGKNSKKVIFSHIGSISISLLNTLKSKFAPVLNKIKSASNRFSLKLKNRLLFYVNRLLTAIVCILLIIMALNIFSTPQNIRLLKNIENEESVKSAKNTVQTVESKPFPYYLSRISGRKLFKIYKAKPEIKKIEKKENPVLLELTNGLFLSGIISDGSRLQAVITDQKRNQTYFLYDGDYIGEIKIENILQNEVVVSYRGETTSINMR